MFPYKEGMPRRHPALVLAGRGPMRTQQAIQSGISHRTLRRLAEAGDLAQVGRGFYALPGAIPEDIDLLTAIGRSHHAVIGLPSALRYHDLTTQNPSEVWLLVPKGAWRPRGSTAPTRVVTVAKALMTLGVERQQIAGHEIRVTNPARTVVDCFKFRRLVGLDVAIEALRDGWKARRFTMDQLHGYAKHLRMANVMRPYLLTLGVG